MLRTKLLGLAAYTNITARQISKLTTVEVNDKTGIATLTMNRPPVNGLSLALLTELRDSIQQIEDNKCRGLILTSANPKVFSAGLELNEMYKTDKAQLVALWSMLQEVYHTLYGTSLATAAAINGHAPAGGCLLATCCEYRVMLPSFVIGLNETQLGIVAPKWIMGPYINLLGRRMAERALKQGHMFTTEEALKFGLVDDVANTKEDAMAKCMQFIGTFEKVNPLARTLTKQQLRAAELDLLEKIRDQDIEQFVHLITKPEAQKALAGFVDKTNK